MENTCIKVISKEHGKKVIEYYQSLGVDTYGWNGNSVGNYYGVFAGNFNYYDKSFDSKIIELPKEQLFKVGDFVFLNPECPLIVRYVGKENIIVESLLEDETNLFNYDTNLFLMLKKYSDYKPKEVINKTKTINKLILCYYINVTNIGLGDIPQYVDDIAKNFTIKDDDSIIQYFIPIKSESRIECIYNPNDKELKDLNEKAEELNKYIKNNK